MPIELLKSDFHRAAGLLEDFPHDRAWMNYAWKDPLTRIWVDDLHEPTAVLISPQRRPVLSFLDGDGGTALELLEQARLQPSPPKMDYISLPALDWLPGMPPGWQPLERVSWPFRESQREVSETRQIRIPDGFELRPIDREIAMRLGKREVPVYEWRDHWPDADEFIAEAFGFCLLRGDEIVSVSWTGYPVGTPIEVEVETSSHYWGQGLAVIVCAAFIRECLRRGLEPLWTTDAVNIASRRLAAKFGYYGEVTHYWLEPIPANIASTEASGQD
jgi:GNAT superfamily N-acetyltransferase